MACLLTFVSALASAAEWGETPLREFSGRVVFVSGERLVVENRMGDRLAFELNPGTRLEGFGEDWAAIALDDRVMVYWSLADMPRWARRVISMSPPQD